MTRFALLALLALGACATTPRIETRTIEVKVPVPVPCTVDVPPPVYSDTDAALRNAPDHFERVKLILAGRIERDAYTQVTIAALQGCNGGEAGR